jgi:dipeptidyl aminopeptidase/acylaminoacyl peptidase
MLALDPQWIRAAGGDASAVRGLIGLSGPYVLKPNTAALNTIFAAPYRSADWQPLQHVTSDAPPALLIHGAADDLVAPLQSEQLDAALRAAGVESTLLLVPQRSHADIVAALSVPARARAPVLAEVRRFIAAHGGR